MMKKWKSDSPRDGCHNTASANDLLDRHTDDEASDEGGEQTQPEADEENSPANDGGTRDARQEAR